MKNLNHLKPGRFRQQGFTLIELMIALAIGLLIMASVLMVIVSASQRGRVSAAESTMNEEGLIALGFLQQQIRLAGYSANAVETGAITRNFIDASIRGCDAGFTDEKAAFNALTCNSSGAGGAAIAIRYQADTLNTMPTGTAPNLKPSNCLLNTIAEDTPSAVTGKPNYALADNRFFIQISGTGSNRPELVCAGAKSNGVYEGPQPLFENVEFMKLVYGVTATGDPADTQIVTYMSANEIDTKFSSDTNINLRWNRVASVKICLLMRSADPVTDGSVSTNTYRDCDGAIQNSDDNYLRRAYITTAQLRNKAAVPQERLE